MGGARSGQGPRWARRWLAESGLLGARRQHGAFRWAGPKAYFPAFPALRGLQALLPAGVGLSFKSSACRGWVLVFGQKIGTFEKGNNLQGVKVRGLLSIKAKLGA